MERCLCRSCGAVLEVRVRFRGSLVWPLDPDAPDFSGRDPELRGDLKDPSLVCSADMMHPTGFRLEDGLVRPIEEP